jgi:hypothetical protein
MAALRKSATTEPTSSFDPVVGLEKIRRDILGVSKSRFYGPNGFVNMLDVIELGPHRKGARLSNVNAVLDAQTRTANHAKA